VSEFGAIDKLRREHLLDRFDRGKEDLNRFLIRRNDTEVVTPLRWLRSAEALRQILSRSWCLGPAFFSRISVRFAQFQPWLYEHFNFESSPSDPYHLLLIMKDLLAIVAG
jgi:hypothetical protein